MYLKWIVCNVNELKKQEFSNAQEKWGRTADSPGFIAQAGGWDLDDENKACIISLWKNKVYLNNFMENFHDKIIEENKQSITYEKISVGFFNKIGKEEGKDESISEVIRDCKFLRVTEFYFSPGSVEDADKIQTKVLPTGISESKEMPGEIILKDENNNLRYLNLTFREGIENQSIIAKNKFPDLGNKEGFNSRITKFVGRRILLIDKWKIIK